MALRPICIHKLLGSLIACLMITWGGSNEARADTTAVPSKPGPNIVWLISEDNGAEHLRLYNPSGAAMPRIEALAASGLVFNHAYSNAPVCSVARTTLITASHAPRVGAHHHRTRSKPAMPDGLQMFPAYLRQAGYYTANNHKKDYNLRVGTVDPWDDSSKQASWRNRADGQPFFFVMSRGTTHESKLHFKDMDRETTINPVDLVLPSIYPDTALFRYTLARYYDLHEQLDRQFGVVIDELASDGLLHSTFIFYFGDHGGALPASKGYVYERGLHVPLVVYVPPQYRDLLDKSLQDPGQRVDGMVSFVDFGPTVLHLAGISPPQDIDGKAFLGPNITLREIESRDTAFGYADRFDEKTDLNRSVRIGNFKYIRRYVPYAPDAVYNHYRYKQLAYVQWLDLFNRGKLDGVRSAFFRPTGPELLFDLSTDPYETNNLAGSPDHQEQLRQLRSVLYEHVGTMPDLGLIPETYLESTPAFLSDPVAFGRVHADRINRYLKLADLQLVPYEQAKARLAEVLLSSEDPVELFWAITTAASFGPESASLAELVGSAVDRIDDPLITAKAAEFAGMTSDGGDATPLIAQALSNSDSMSEALAVLNSAAILKMTPQGFKSDLSIPESLADEYWLRVRLNYLRD